MAYYDFICHDCGHTWVEQLSMVNYDEEKPTECPECHSENMGRHIHAGNMPNIGDPVAMGVKKVPSDFKQHMSNIKSNAGMKTEGKFD